MDVVQQAGTDLALPSQTLYLGRDRDRAADPNQEAERNRQGVQAAE